MHRPTREVLSDLVNKGYVEKQTHEYLPLEIYNYTAQAMFDNYWPDAVRAARGLVMDTNGRIVSLPFAKFFNLEEHSPEVLQQYQNIEYVIQEKKDGSLIQVVQDPEYGLIVASRKSFHSWHAQQAQELINSRSYYFDYNITYLFELIGQENQIVVNYGPGLELVLLGAIHVKPGTELETNLYNLAGQINHPTQSLPNQWKTLPLDQIKNHIRDDEEGVVVKFKDGFRIKVKGDQYVYLHRLISGLNEKTVWQAIVDGTTLSSDLPEEFQQWIDEVRDRLNAQYKEIEQQVYDVYYQVPDADRKTQAQFIKTHIDNPGLVFSLLDGRQDKLHWGICKQIKPKITQDVMDKTDIS